MGATCCGGNKSNPRGETNLQTYKGKGRGNSTDLNSLPIFTVIKAQALMRGFLARRRVKKLYGFEMRTGLMAGSGKSLNADELAVQRQRVVLIREKLPTFEYGLY